jgi:hypothetical protein
MGMHYGRIRGLTSVLLMICYTTGITVGRQNPQHIADTGTKYVQQLPSHRDIKTMMINSHISQPLVEPGESPLDNLKQDNNRR